MLEPHQHTCKPLGPINAARRYGVAPKTFHQWRYRDSQGRKQVEPMPAPDWPDVAGSPAWCVHTLDAWALRTGHWDGAPAEDS
jgi:hypothetical protein